MYPTWVRKGISRAIKLLNKTPSARGREPPRELSREAPEVLKTIKVIATAIGCLPELDEKTPLLKALHVHALTVGRGEMKLGLN